MKVWVTKYALTEGIMAMEANVCTVGEGGMIEITKDVSGKKPTHSWYLHKPDWHTDWQSARLKAIDMAEKKLKSIQKQADKVKVIRDTLSKQGDAP